MKELALCIAFPYVAACLPAQNVGFQVTSAIETSGQPCDPFTCTVPQVMADDGTSLLLRTRGASFQPHFLLASSQTLPCVQLPGFGNSLLLDGPAAVSLLNLSWSVIYVSAPPGVPVCGGRIGSSPLPIPAGVPSGASVRLQLLAPLPTLTGEVWTFSSAVDVVIQ